MSGNAEAEAVIRRVVNAGHGLDGYLGLHLHRGEDLRNDREAYDAITEWRAAVAALGQPVRP